MRALLIYWSKTGNTKKAADAIFSGLLLSNCIVEYESVEKAKIYDFLDFDLICIGFPSYSWRPPKQVEQFLCKKLTEYGKNKFVKVGSPVIPNKYALIFCTYSGSHTGINEAIPPVKFVGQFFEHLGFTIVDEWYIIGEHHGSLPMSTLGRCGDIRGRPNKEDLEIIQDNTAKLILRLSSMMQ